MAYRMEGEELVIDGWERGISDGPYSIFSPSALGPVNQTGTVDLSYVNITGIPGEVSVNFPLAAVSAPATSYTLTGSLSGGATSATLTANWTDPQNSTVRATFSNGDARSVTVTTGSTAITWSGGLSGAASASISIQWTFTGAVQFTTDSAALDYVLDQSGRVWTSDETSSVGVTTWTARGSVAYLSSSNSGGSTSVTVGNNGGCVWWQGYLLVMFLGKVYYSSDNGVTFTDWTGTVGSIYNGQNFALSSKVSDSVYFCNQNAVASIILTPGATFNPSSTATFSWGFGSNASAVKIPSYDTSMCLGEINGLILIGGLLNRVYPWDANNLAGTGVTSLVGLPLFLGDRGVRRIVVVNSNAYIFPGLPNNAGTLVPSGRGYIYVSNGTQIDVFAKMPDNFVSIAGTTAANSAISMPYWYFGDAIWHRNQLLFGAVAADNINNSVISDTGGVWAIDLGSKALYRTNKMTSGTSALPLGLLSFSITNGTITVPGMGYFAADSSVLNNSSTVMSTSGRIISDKIPVGTKTKPKTYEQLELKMAVALATGESVDVVVYTDKNPTGLTIGSMISTDGMSKVFTPLNFQAIQWLMVQCTLNPTSTNPTFVRLRDVRLR